MNMNLPRTKAVERPAEGLRAFFGKIYQYMAGSLVLSGLTAYASTQEPLVHLLYTVQPDKVSLSALGWVVLLAPFVLIFMIQNAAGHLNAAKANFYFWLFAALFGLSMGSVFTVYVPSSVVQTFLITAVSFLGLSVWGSATKRDLTGFGSFLVMGLIGMIVAMIVNIFLASSLVSFVVSVLGVFIFAGLIAYDTQRLKAFYYQSVGNPEMQNVVVVTGALSLYLDFVNLFQFLLNFLGERR